jgi:hypothetical protein
MVITQDTSVAGVIRVVPGARAILDSDRISPDAYTVDQFFLGAVPV